MSSYESSHGMSSWVRLQKRSVSARHDFHSDTISPPVPHQIRFVMAYFLKKILESANRLNSTNSSSSSSLNLNFSISSHASVSDQVIVCSSSTGEFDRIPIDIFMQILKLLGPKEAAKLIVVCKSWKLIVSCNNLWIYYLQNKKDPWDAMFFAESNLRSGYPLRYIFFRYLWFFEPYDFITELYDSFKFLLIVTVLRKYGCWNCDIGIRITIKFQISCLLQKLSFSDAIIYANLWATSSGSWSYYHWWCVCFNLNCY